MYKNIEAEIARNGLTRKQIAKKLGLSNSTESLKLNGKANITLGEAIEIKKILKTDMTLENLFEVS